MKLFNKGNGLMNVIRCDEPSYLIWKWRPSGSQDGKRENAIRWGSSLRVKDGEVAVFVYHQQGGVYQDFIEGPFDQLIQTSNLPVLVSLIGKAYNGDSPFQAEIYFINLAQIVQVKFGVPFFDVYDPRFADFGVPVAVRGTVSFRIDDYREFIKLHRLSEFHLDDFQKQIRDVVTRYIKDTVANAPATHNISVIQIESRIAQINDAVEYDIAERLKEDFGVAVSGVDIGAIEVDKASEGFVRLMEVTRDVSTATVQAQTEVKIKQMHDLQRIEAENYEETLRIQREEGQYATHLHTQTTNFPAFQVEKQAEVGVAGANALGQMGANGGGGVDLGGGGGFNPAAMMAGMAVGGAIGQNIAGTMNGMMSGMQPGATPPPIPMETYYVVQNGQSAGPFTLEVIRQMIAANQILRDTLMWTNGMPEWVKAENIDAIQTMFSQTPPPVPENKSE